MLTILNRKRLALLAAAILAAAGTTFAAMHLHKPAEPVAVATVNGTPIAASTLAALEAQGLSRADALASAIFVRVAARAAAARYPEEVATTLRRAQDALQDDPHIRKDVVYDALLSKLYRDRRTGELSKDVTDAEIKQLYAERIKQDVVKALDRPSLESITERLRNEVANQKVTDELKTLRDKAEVKLLG